MTPFSIFGKDPQEDANLLELKLPCARQYQKLTLNEDEVSPPHIKRLVQKAVNLRSQVNNKRASQITEFYIRREPFIIPLKNELKKILSSHPFPLLQGPLIQQLDVSFDPDILSSKTRFQHDVGQDCYHWKSLQTGLHGFRIIEDKNLSKELIIVDEATYKVKNLNECNIYGPACSLDRKLIYTCLHERCRIECPCTLCMSGDGLPGEDVNFRRWKESPQQCQHHKLKLPWTFNVKEDSFTMVASDLNHYHFATPHAGIPLSCKACSKDVLEHQILHLVVHMNCKFCQQDFRPFDRKSIVTVTDFKEAEVELFRKEESTCPECWKICPDKTSRKRHQKRTHDDQPCPDCNQSFTSFGRLEYHINVVHSDLKKKAKLVNPNEDELFECYKCGSKFNKHYNLLRHLKEVHRLTELNLDYAGKDDLAFSCSDCKSTFMRKSHLKRHRESVHSMESNFICPICGKRTTRKDNHNRHIKICNR